MQIKFVCIFLLFCAFGGIANSADTNPNQDFPSADEIESNWIGVMRERALCESSNGGTGEYRKGECLVQTAGICFYRDYGQCCNSQGTCQDCSVGSCSAPPEAGESDVDN